MPKITRSVTLEFDTWANARRMGVNVSEACERGLMMFGERKNETVETKLDRVRFLLTDQEKIRFGNQVKRFENWQPSQGGETKTKFGTTVFREPDLIAPPSPYEELRKRIRCLVGVSLTEHEVRDLFIPRPSA